MAVTTIAISIVTAIMGNGRITAVRATALNAIAMAVLITVLSRARRLVDTWAIRQQ